MRNMEGTGCEKIVKSLQNDERGKKMQQKRITQEGICKGKSWKVESVRDTYMLDHLLGILSLFSQVTHSLLTNSPTL